MPLLQYSQNLGIIQIHFLKFDAFITLYLNTVSFSFKTATNLALLPPNFTQLGVFAI